MLAGKGLSCPGSFWHVNNKIDITIPKIIEIKSDLPQFFKAFADDKFNVAGMIFSVFDGEENIVGKRENAG